VTSSVTQHRKMDGPISHGRKKVVVRGDAEDAVAERAREGRLVRPTLLPTMRNDDQPPAGQRRADMAVTPTE